MLTKRRLLGSGAAALVAMPSVLRAQETKSIVIAEPVHSLGYLPLYVAARTGIFEKAKLDVRIMTIENPSGHINAVLGGQAFAFIGGPEHCAFAKLKGGELRAVAGVVDRANLYFVAGKGKEPAPGQSMKDYFRGKSVAAWYFGTTPNSITRYYLSRWGLEERKDVTLVETIQAASVAAIKIGKVDIGSFLEPQISQGIREGLWGEPFINVPRDLGPYAFSTLNVQAARLATEASTAERLVRAVAEGLRVLYAQPDEAAAIARREFPTMAADDLKATLDRSFADEIWSKDGTIPQQSWATNSAVVRGAGVLKQDVGYDDIIDMRFLKAA